MKSFVFLRHKLCAVHLICFVIHCNDLLPPVPMKVAWKNNKNMEKSLGKTSSVLSFAEKYYEHVVYLNFFQNASYASVFSGSLEVDDLIILMSALLGPDSVFVAGKTIIVLEEIQECPEARTALKFFKLDGRFDVIGTGSLLGVRGYNKEPKSIPVGFETILDMYPMDFEEFLWAKNVETRS